MWSSSLIRAVRESGRRRLIVLGVSGVLLLIIVAALLRVPVLHRYAVLAPCMLERAQGAQQECVFGAIEQELKAKSTGDALKLFKTALPILLAGNPKLCHDLAHRVGDITYFNLYIFDPDAVTFTYPPESMTCDYGFYHGFYEHYFQERPNTETILKTCGALPSGPEPYKRVIRQTCFHGAGHGLVLAQIDHIPQDKWGDWHTFTDKPLAQCAQLTGLQYDEFSRCPLGIFAEIAQWRLLNNYGFNFDGPADHRFDECLTYASADTQKYCMMTNAIVSDIAFGAPATLDACKAVKGKDNFESCVGGTILGLYINGADEARVRTGLSLCTDAGIAARGATDMCYVNQEWALAAYFTDAQHEAYCTLFPEPYRSARCLLPQFEGNGGMPAH
jgi:hypothetical protein